MITGSAHSTDAPTPSATLFNLIINGEINGVNTKDQNTTPGTVCVKPYPWFALINAPEMTKNINVKNMPAVTTTVNVNGDLLLPRNCTPNSETP